MSDFDAQKYFNEVSKSVQEDDNIKLAELMAQEAPEPEIKQPVEEEQPELEDKPIPDGDAPEPKEGEEDSPLGDEPADKATEEKGKDKDEQDEMAAVREQLEQLRKENHNLKSQAGRFPHVQKRLREMDKKLEELTKAKDSPSSQASKKYEPVVDEALKKIRDDDAELADAIKAAIAAALNGVEKDSTAKEYENLKFLRDQEASTYEQAEIDRLLTMHPNAKEVFVSPHWTDWMGKQSAGVKALAESNSADDVSTAFKLYAQDMARQYPDLVKAPEAKAPGNDEATAKAAQIEQDRLRKKTNSADLGNPTGSAKKGPVDAQALFDKYIKDIEKEMGL